LRLIENFVKETLDFPFARESSAGDLYQVDRGRNSVEGSQHSVMRIRELSTARCRRKVVLSYSGSGHLDGAVDRSGEAGCLGHVEDREVAVDAGSCGRWLLGTLSAVNGLLARAVDEARVVSAGDKSLQFIGSSPLEGCKSFG
jgi:hypothetical protein